MNFNPRCPVVLLLFLILNFLYVVPCASSSSLVEGVTLNHKFKSAQAKAEYLKSGGHDCVHKAPQVQICGMTAFSHNRDTESLETKQAAYLNCLNGLHLHEYLVDYAEKIQPEFFYDNEAFKFVYMGVLKNYVRALDQKYRETGQGPAIKSSLVFHFSWLPWIVLLAAFGIIYGLNRVDKASPSQPQTESVSDENV